jgi:UDP-3-O-[3-hydroxymyristoyl] glucosamine N-acyltransferase
MGNYTAGELADLVGGRLVGDPSARAGSAAGLGEAGSGDLAFLRDDKMLEEAAASGAAVLFTSVEIDGFAGAQVICEDVDAALATVLDLLSRDLARHPSGVSDRASVSPSAELGEGVAVGDFAFVGDDAVLGDGAIVYPNAHVGTACKVGARTVIYAGAKVHDGVTVGCDCVIQYGAVIGAEGFGFVQREGRHVKLAQVGTVRIGDRVDIGALTTVDRAMLEATVIEDGTKIDNHCHIAHNCHIGPDCIIAGCSKLAGSVTLGRGVIVAEDVGISDHVTVGDGAILGAGSGCPRDVPAGAIMLGYPAHPIGQQRRIYAMQSRLPEMSKRLRTLEKEVERLEAERPEAT